MKRKKRLEKGMKSLKQRILEHEKKLQEAKEKGDEELAFYYEKEIAMFENEEEKKKEQFEKQ